MAIAGNRMLYVGALFRGSTALQRMNALHDLSMSIVSIDTHSADVLRRSKTLRERLRCRLLGPRDIAGANRAIREAVCVQEFDILWIDKGVTIESETLAHVAQTQPRCRIVGYSPDDMMNPGNQSRQFIESLPRYDVYFTTKSFGVDELHRLGARRVVFVGNAFDPEVHRPMELTAEQRAALGGPVGFIGFWEEERAEALCFLASSGIDVRVWGPPWPRWSHRPLGLRLEGRPLWHDDYARAICSFDINLCFLRKANRDYQTTRSMEIPACGGFMLAERTNEHLSLFEEGKEAEFFEGSEELLEKTRYYLAHPSQRRAIAEAGFARCLQSGYRNQDRMAFMLDIVRSLDQMPRHSVELWPRE